MALLNVEVGTEESSGKIANIEQIIMAINALSKVLILICNFLLHLFFHFLLVTSFLPWTSNFSSFFANFFCDLHAFHFLESGEIFFLLNFFMRCFSLLALILEHCE